jgi:hypothetical protein
VGSLSSNSSTVLVSAQESKGVQAEKEFTQVRISALIRLYLLTCSLHCRQRLWQRLLSYASFVLAIPGLCRCVGHRHLFRRRSY